MLSKAFQSKNIISFKFQKKMGRMCSVNGCKSVEHLFSVRECWYSLNHLGWKSHKKQRICKNHFLESHIGGKPGKPFILQWGKPFFSENQR